MIKATCPLIIVRSNVKGIQCMPTFINQFLGPLSAFPEDIIKTQLKNTCHATSSMSCTFWDIMESSWRMKQIKFIGQVQTENLTCCFIEATEFNGSFFLSIIHQAVARHFLYAELQNATNASSSKGSSKADIFLMNVYTHTHTFRIHLWGRLDTLDSLKCLRLVSASLIRLLDLFIPHWKILLYR